MGPLADKERSISSTPRRPALSLLHDLRLEAALPVPRHVGPDRIDVGHPGLGASAVPRAAAALPGRIMPATTETARQPALESGLQQPLRQLLEQTAPSRQLQALGLGPGYELVQEPVVHSCRGSPRRLCLADHRCTLP